VKVVFHGLVTVDLCPLEPLAQGRANLQALRAEKCSLSQDASVVRGIQRYEGTVIRSARG